MLLQQCKIEFCRRACYFLSVVVYISHGMFPLPFFKCIRWLRMCSSLVMFFHLNIILMCISRQLHVYRHVCLWRYMCPSVLYCHVHNWSCFCFVNGFLCVYHVNYICRSLHVSICTLLLWCCNCASRSSADVYIREWHVCQVLCLLCWFLVFCRSCISLSINIVSITDLCNCSVGCAWLISINKLSRKRSSQISPPITV